MAKKSGKSAPNTKDASKTKSAGSTIAATRTIGVLHLGSKLQFELLVNSMNQAAQEYLRSKGSTDTIAVFDGGHYAGGDLGILQQQADLLVNNTAVELIVAAGGPQSALAAMEATSEVDGPRSDLPIVFTTVADPVASGLVKSLNKPGRNLTGMAGKTSENDPMRLELLHEYVSPSRPLARKVGALVNPSRPGWQKQYQDLREKADDLKLTLVIRRARNLAQIRNAFRNVFSNRTFLGAVVTADAFFNDNRATIVTEANQQNVPTIYQWRAFAEAGGLMSYGPSLSQAYKRAGRYVGRIMHDGEKPAEMACSKPAGFELVISQSAASGLGFSVPTMIGDEEVKAVP